MSEAMVNENRRRFLKQAGVAGALVWTAPMITSAVHAQAPGTAEPCATCSGRGRGLFVRRQTTTMEWGDTDDTASPSAAESENRCETVVDGDVASYMVDAAETCGVNDFSSGCTSGGSVTDFSGTGTNVPTVTINSASADVTLLCDHDCNTAPTFTFTPASTVVTIGSAAPVSPTQQIPNETFEFFVDNGNQDYNATVVFNETLTGTCPATNPPAETINGVHITLTRTNNSQTIEIIAAHGRVVRVNCACP